MKDAVPGTDLSSGISTSGKAVAVTPRPLILFGLIFGAILADQVIRFAVDKWVIPPRVEDEVAWVFYLARVAALKALSDVPLLLACLVLAFVFWSRFRLIAVLMLAFACIPVAGLIHGIQLVTQAPALLSATPVPLPWSSVRDFHATSAPDAAWLTCLGGCAALVVVALLMRREDAA